MKVKVKLVREMKAEVVVEVDDLEYAKAKFATLKSAVEDADLNDLDWAETYWNVDDWDEE